MMKARAVRRNWSPSEKAAIVAEAMQDGVTVVGTARKYGVSTVSIYTWKKELDEGRSASPAQAESPPPAPAMRQEAADAVIRHEAQQPVERKSVAAREPVAEIHDLVAEIATLSHRLERIEARQAAFEENRVALRDVLRAIGSQLQLLARLGDPDFGGHHVMQRSQPRAVQDAKITAPAE